jgi:hypothetical protein
LPSPIFGNPLAPEVTDERSLAAPPWRLRIFGLPFLAARRLGYGSPTRSRVLVSVLVVFRLVVRERKSLVEHRVQAIDRTALGLGLRLQTSLLSRT